MNSPSKANGYLQTSNQDLRALFRKIKELEELSQRVQPMLPENLASYCQVANLVGNRLVLIVANGSIATQIRFLSADLLEKFKQDAILKRIQGIDCKVRPSPSSPKPTNAYQRKMPPLSQETAELVRDMAGSLEDPKLRKIMEKIAGHIDTGKSKTS